MKIAVCDDEIQFIDNVCILLEQWAKKHGIELNIYQFTNGDDLIAAHQNKCMDLIFLDVIMPLLNGMDTARELRNNNQMVPIIFLTSSKEFALASYEVKALNYLTKPVEDAKLVNILDEFLKTTQNAKETFTARTSIGFYKITIDDVDYLEAQNKQVIVHLSNGTTIEIRELFSKCEEIFTLEKGFFKCHRSYIVHLSHVEQFTKTQINTNNGSTIPISRNNYCAFKETYFSYMFQ